MNEITVDVQGLGKAYHDQARGVVTAVHDLSFSCTGGEVFGLLGANGAGKTTTLRMLATLLTPTAGTATVMGHRLGPEAAAVRRAIGFYSSSTALYPRLTARETLEFFARLNGCDRSGLDRRVADAIVRFGIEAYADTRIDALSTGMRQRVSLARTVVHDPPVLIFDEPSLGLDVLSALALQQTVRDLAAEGKTILFSTHIMSEAERVCDRIAILHRARILAVGTLAELRAATGRHYLEDIFLQCIESPLESADERRTGGASPAEEQG
jgi:sodium transport system ATP-binding protein